MPNYCDYFFTNWREEKEVFRLAMATKNGNRPSLKNMLGKLMKNEMVFNKTQIQKNQHWIKHLSENLARRQNTVTL